MSQFVEGLVQATADPAKAKVFQTKYGPRYNFSFKMPDGQWYVIKFRKTDEPAPFSKGVTVSFMFDVDTSRTNQTTGQPIVENIVNAKSLTVGGQPMQGSPQQGGYQQQPQQQYPQQGYAQPQQAQQPAYQPQQQAMQQAAPQSVGPNWEGKEGMATGMALQCAARLTSNIDEVPALAARILLLQEEMIKGLQSQGQGYLQGLTQPVQVPVQQAQAMPEPPPMAPQQAPQAQAQPAQPGNPAAMVPAGFDAPPPG